MNLLILLANKIGAKRARISQNHSLVLHNVESSTLQTHLTTVKILQGIYYLGLVARMT